MTLTNSSSSAAPALAEQLASTIVGLHGRPLPAHSSPKPSISRSSAGVSEGANAL
jgi:hypothetical protein